MNPIQAISISTLYQLTLLINTLKWQNHSPTLPSMVHFRYFPNLFRCKTHPRIQGRSPQPFPLDFWGWICTGVNTQNRTCFSSCRLGVGELEVDGIGIYWLKFIYNCEFWVSYFQNCGFFHFLRFSGVLSGFSGRNAIFLGFIYSYGNGGF